MAVPCNEVHLFHNREAGFDTFCIEIPAASMDKWCLHVCLLLFHDTVSLSVGPSADGHILSISRCKENAGGNKRGTYRHSGSNVEIQLPEEQVLVWMRLPLDNLYSAYVENPWLRHIDVELDSADGHRSIFDLTIAVV